MPRGRLRVYLGAAPGVGKTYRMLEEGHRRVQRGTDVVIAYVETHDRPFTAAMVEGLEMVQRRAVMYRGSTFTELDLDAVLARRPEVALVDEMAHTNVPGSRHEKRWEDINELLDAGINVITTVNVQHLESLNDVVEKITRVEQREQVPDAVVRSAEQIELVDMTAEAIRKRMAHGNIYQPDKVDAALTNYFRVGNLTALRELALLWLADKVDQQLGKYREDNEIDSTWETRERVVVALTGGAEGDTLIRRAARIADRAHRADLLAVHVVPTDGLAGVDLVHLSRQRTLVESMGGTYHQVIGDDVPDALLSFARGVNATQLVLGASRRSRLRQMFSPGVAIDTVAESGSIDVHLITHDASHQRGRRPDPPGQRLARPLGAVVGTIVVLPLLSAVLVAVPGESLTSDILIFLVAVVALSVVGGWWTAVFASILSFFLLNYFFVPPLHHLTINDPEDLLALAVFFAVALTVTLTVELAARRSREASRAGREATTLAAVAGSVLRGSEPLPALLEQLRESLSMRSVVLLERVGEETGPNDRADPNCWHVVEAVGDDPSLTPDQADVEIGIEGGFSLALRGQPIAADDQRIVEAFAAQSAVAVRQQRLAEQAAAAAPLAEADQLRTALLRAVSHDLRSPLSSAKAAVAGLLSTDVEFDEADRRELLQTADQSLDLLTRLVENLLDMSRLQAGALGVRREPVSVAELVARAVDQVGYGPDGVVLQVPADLPDVYADSVLMERVLVNLLSNARRYSPPDRPPTVTASTHDQMLHVAVIDRGPGLPHDDWEQAFLPFQRFGDQSRSDGIGLGLALSRGLAEAMDGHLTASPTPGGGLTMDLELPVVPGQGDISGQGEWGLGRLPEGTDG